MAAGSSAAKDPANRLTGKLGGETSALVAPLVKGGKIVAGPTSVDKIRAYVLAQLNEIPMVD